MNSVLSRISGLMSGVTGGDTSIGEFPVSVLISLCPSSLPSLPCVNSSPFSSSTPPDVREGSQSVAAVTEGPFCSLSSSFCASASEP